MCPIEIKARYEEEWVIYLSTSKLKGFSFLINERHWFKTSKCLHQFKLELTTQKKYQLYICFIKSLMKPCSFWINLSEFRNLESAIFPQKEHVIAISHFEKTKMVIKGSNLKIKTPSVELTLPWWGGLSTKKFQPECVNEKSSTDHRS